MSTVRSQQLLRKENLTEIASNHDDHDFGQYTQRSAIILHKREPMVEKTADRFEIHAEIANVERYSPQHAAIEAFNEDENRLMPHELYKLQIEQQKQQRICQKQPVATQRQPQSSSKDQQRRQGVGLKQPSETLVRISKQIQDQSTEIGNNLNGVIN